MENKGDVALRCAPAQSVALVERYSREEQALCGTSAPHEIAAAHRKSAAAESRHLLDLMALRDSTLNIGERDRLTREINQSREFIERRLAKAAELDGEQFAAAAE